MKNSWTIPKVKSYPLETEKEWYVWFRFNGVLKFVKTGINKIPNYSERLEEANLLAEVLKERLEKGWVPDNSTKIGKSCRVIEAVSYGFEQKKLSVKKNTIDNFQSTVNFFCEAIRKLKFDKMIVANFERGHAKAILEYLKKEKNWTNKNYNKHLGYLRSIGSGAKVGGYAKSLDNLNKKKVLSFTPLSCNLKFLIFALKDSAEALVLLLSK
ncbi:hypothetical protein CHRY9293_00873 [Chryseobacterium potabilaquae]|uniref:Core-binding (CB) domain-containing protein n=1 Tax=Chryseobacterium potabilaquae TaxID=2675057 RepID=A0A6N4X894_9FLAO|nr:hypothetical protein CHRY9293_00873 [Chryseobacterium potabilaquae]